MTGRIPVPTGVHPDLTAPLDGATHGRLVFRGGTPDLDLSAGRSSAHLLEASFAGGRPRIRSDAGVVVVTYPSGLRAWLRYALRPAVARFALNGSVPWTFEFHGGVDSISADLRELVVSSIDLRSGIGGGTLWLPRPTGTLRLAIAGGVSGLVIHRPMAIPMRTVIRGGVSSLTIDDEALGPLGGGWRRESTGWHGAPDRLDIAIASGVSNLVIAE